MWLARFSTRFAGSRSLIAALAIALVLRALVPVGFMPERHGVGGFHLDFCPAHGFDPNLAGHAGEDVGDDAGACAYGGCATAAPPPPTAAPSLAPQPQTHFIVASTPTEIAPTIVRAQSSRAPPRSA